MNHENPSLRSASGNHRWVYELVDDGLVRNYEQAFGPRRSEEHFAMARLSPHLAEVTGRATGYWKYFLCGILLLVLSAMMFMPMIETGKWPLALLAFGVVPVLLAILMFGVGIQAVRVRTWTIVRSVEGHDIAFWDRGSCDPNEREAFEAAYRAAFEAVV